MNDDQIFITDNSQLSNQQNSGEDQNIPLCDPYLKKGDSIRYVDQFLTQFPIQTSLKMQEKPNQNQQKSQHLDEIPSEGNITPSQEIENGQQISPSQIQFHSVFHNFQKHLTIFLRSILKPDQIKNTSEEGLVARDLWRVFYKSCVNAKRIIHIILGELDIRGKDKELKQLNLKQLYAKNTSEKIRKGKQVLRQYVRTAIQKTDMQKYLDKTRIKNKEYFELYLRQFILQLKAGVFKRRIRRDTVLKTIN